MINAIYLENFKAFGKGQTVPIKPITLVYGANSAGKSSILHGLLLIQHAMATRDCDAHHTILGGESVDLGGFRQFVHKRDAAKNVTLGFDLKLSSNRYAPRRTYSIRRSFGLELDDQGDSLPHSKPLLKECEIFVKRDDEDDEELFMRFIPGGSGLDRLSVELVVESPAFENLLSGIVFGRNSRRSVRELVPDDLRKWHNVLSRACGNLKFHNNSFLPNRLFLSNRLSASFPRWPEGREKISFDDPDFEDVVTRRLSYVIYHFLRTLSMQLEHSLLSRMRSTSLGPSLRYLGPMRYFPPRHLTTSKYSNSNWDAGGGFAWDIVATDPDIREKVNFWLSAKDRLQTPYKLVLHESFDVENVKAILNDIPAFWDSLQRDCPADSDLLKNQGYSGYSQYAEINEADTVLLKRLVKQLQIACDGIDDRSIELVLIDQRSNTRVSHRDIGIGISQVLPVLVSAYASRRSLITIEQPEIHLHPALQADLADVFIESALGENRNRFLLETHSEHLVLRIMRRMRQTREGNLPEGFQPVTPDDVGIIFVKSVGNKSIKRILELNENGELLDPWPDGFFETGLREILQ